MLKADPNDEVTQTALSGFKTIFLFLRKPLMNFISDFVSGTGKEIDNSEIQSNGDKEFVRTF